MSWTVSNQGGTATTEDWSDQVYRLLPAVLPSSEEWLRLSPYHGVL
ncbi:MAG: hypothetical protein ACFBSC_01865 [Microcoleaceae cyanobacterium]